MMPRQPLDHEAAVTLYPVAELPVVVPRADARDDGDGAEAVEGGYPHERDDHAGL